MLPKLHYIGTGDWSMCGLKHLWPNVTYQADKVTCGNCSRLLSQRIQRQVKQKLQAKAVT